MKIFRIMKACLCVLLSAGQLPSSINAEIRKQDVSEIFDMSISELLNIEIVSVSKQPETAAMAPGTAYVFDEEDLKRFGFRFLQDALKFAPSVYLYDPHSWVWGGQRGLVSNFSQTLLLVNGREVNNLIAGEGFISRQFSTHNLKQIEVVASPASAIYGANALAGVINMVTKDADPDYEGVELGVQGGSFEERAFDIVFGKRVSDDFRIGGSARYFTSNEEDYSNFVNDQENFLKGWKDATRAASIKREYKNPSEASVSSLQVDFKGMYAGIFSFYNRQSHGLEKLDWSFADSEDHRDFELVFGGFREEVAESLKLKVEYQRVKSKLWGRYHPGLWPVSRLESGDNINIFTLPGSVTTSTGQTLTGVDEIKGFYDSFAHYLIDQGIIDQNNISPADIQKYFTHIYTNKNSRGSLRQKVELELEWLPYTGTSLISGLSLDNVSYAGLAVTDAGTGLGGTYDTPVDRSLTKDVYESRKYGAFIQLKNELMKSSLWLTAGARYDHQNHYGGTVNPRGSLVWQPAESRVLKLIYSEAFREPNVFELSGNPDINPAKLRAIEVSYSELFGKYLKFSATGYQNRVTNFLSSVGSIIGEAPGAVTGQTVRGVETRIDGTLKEFRIFVNGSFIPYLFQDVANGGLETKSEVVGIPRERISAGLTYSPTKRYDLSLLYKYTHAYEALSGNTSISRSFSIPAANELSGAIRVKKIKLGNTRAEALFSVSNITNSSFYHANIRRSGPHKFLQDGRALSLRVVTSY